MANDRLRLVCKFCGDSQMLFKFYSHNNDCCKEDEYSLRGYVAENKKLDDFMVKHIYGEKCGGLHHKFDFNGETVFRLETENQKRVEVA